MIGDTIVKIKVPAIADKEIVEVDTLVDTGATYTALPEEFLEKLKVKRVRKVKIEFANGNVEERDIGNVWIEVNGIKTPNPVIFAKENDAIILGLVTLESCGLILDTVNKKLVPLPKIHHY
ncbi:MAG: retroviral-like aspartic protease family protein [bacterium]|nr:retroviral-like aspartic protease family protein [bacterium]